MDKIKVELFARITCPNCGAVSETNDLDIYEHDWDEFDSEMRCEGKLDCKNCGHKQEFRTHCT